jgi:hypothetical protein
MKRVYVFLVWVDIKMSQSDSVGDILTLRNVCYS